MQDEAEEVNICVLHRLCFEEIMCHEADLFLQVGWQQLLPLCYRALEILNDELDARESFRKCTA